MKREKGVVMQAAADDHVIVMTSQGEFIRVPFTKPVSIGQEIFYTIKPPPILWKWSLVAALFLAIVSSANQIQEIPGGMAPAYYLILDMNPSIELGINASQRVVSAEGLNQEGTQLLSKLKLVGHNLKQALQCVSTQAESAGYLKSGENQIVVTFSQQDVDGFSQLGLGGEGSPSNQGGNGGGIEQIISAAIEETLAMSYAVQLWKMPASARQELRTAGTTPANYIAKHQGGSAAALPVAAAALEQGDYFTEMGIEITRPIFNHVQTMFSGPKE